MDVSKLLERASGPAIATDSENCVIGLNRGARELLGYPPRDSVGRNLHSLMQVRDTFGNRLSDRPFAFHEMVSYSEPVRSFNVEVLTAAGVRLRVAVSVIVVMGEEKDAFSLVYQLRPIYRRRKADEAIERLLTSGEMAGVDPLVLRRSNSSRNNHGLTPRQIEVLRLMAGGANTQEMAATLGISVNTVRTHVQRVFRRLEVHSQLEAVAMAFRNHLI